MSSQKRAAQLRQASARYYERNKTYIIEKRRRASKLPKINKTIVNGKEYYTMGELAKALDRSSATLKRWIAMGKFPEPMGLYRNEGLYTTAEAEVVISAWKLAGSNLHGRDGLNRLIRVKDQQYPWYQWVRDNIYDLRRKAK